MRFLAIAVVTAASSVALAQVGGEDSYNGIQEMVHNGSALSATTGNFSGAVSAPSYAATAECSLAEGLEATGDYDTACAGESSRFDIDGVQRCSPVTDTAPSSLRITASAAAPLATGGNQTGSTLMLRPGSGTHKAVVTAASFVNNTTTFTVKIDGTDNTGTEGTAFECDSVTNAVCATNIATWADALTGVDACAGAGCTAFTGVSGTVYFWPAVTDPAKVTDSIACSTGAAATLTNGTTGPVQTQGTQLIVAGGATSAAVLLGGTTSSFPQVCRNGAVALFAKADSCATTNAAQVQGNRFDVIHTDAALKGVFQAGTSNTGLLEASDQSIIFNSTADLNGGTRDVSLTRSAAGFLAATSQAAASPLGKGQTLTYGMSAKTATFAGGGGAASAVTSGLIPDGAVVVGITTRVTTTATTCTSVNIGDGTTVNLFTANSGVTQNTTTTTADAPTAAGILWAATAAKEVTITAVGGNCVSGVWAVTANYLLPTAATAN